MAPILTLPTKLSSLFSLMLFALNQTWSSFHIVAPTFFLFEFCFVCFVYHISIHNHRWVDVHFLVKGAVLLFS